MSTLESQYCICQMNAHICTAFRHVCICKNYNTTLQCKSIVHNCLCTMPYYSQNCLVHPFGDSYEECQCDQFIVCNVVTHKCVCEKTSRCLALENHKCICEKYGSNNCLSINHHCVCNINNKRYKCKSVNHKCTCILNDSCKSTTTHTCICLKEPKTECKTTNHICVCYINQKAPQRNSDVDTDENIINNDTYNSDNSSCCRYLDSYLEDEPPNILEVPSQCMDVDCEVISKQIECPSNNHYCICNHERNEKCKATRHYQ